MVPEFCNEKILMQKLFILLCLLAYSISPATAQDFWSWWGDGKGELSSYKVIVSRYGELREGHSVLIFVTEDISRTTRIKVESAAIPPNDRVPVLKLNRLVKFTTGLYDYSLLTSTFSSVNSELGRKPFAPLKISFSAQEWCGHVFQMLRRAKTQSQNSRQCRLRRQSANLDSRAERRSLAGRPTPRAADFSQRVVFTLGASKSGFSPGLDDQRRGRSVEVNEWCCTDLALDVASR
jgi:hypothetical protein